MKENKFLRAAKRTFNSIASVAGKYVSNPVALVFFILLIVLFVHSMILAVASDGESLKSWLFQDAGDYFMDFFNTMMYANREDLYTNYWIIYPPFIEIFFCLITRAVPDGASLTSFELRSYQSAIIIFVLVFAVCFTVLGVVFYKLKKGTPFEKTVFVVVMFLSLPFFSVIDRGNIIVMAVVFSALFLMLYRSENAFHREISYICIAVATAIKLYPFLLVLVLLKEKNFTGFLRSCIYSAILFFLPFLYFGNVSENIRAYFRNVFGWSAQQTSEAPESFFTALSCDFKHTAEAVKNRVAALSDFEEIVSISSKVEEIDGTLSYTGTLQILVAFVSGDYATLEGCKALGNVILIAAFVSGFFLKDWRNVAVWSLVSLTISSGTYTYSLCFMAMPCLLFLNQANFKNPLHWAYMLCFVGMFGVFSTEFTYWNCGLTGYSIRLGEFMSRLSVLVMTILLIWEGLSNAVFKLYRIIMMVLRDKELFKQKVKDKLNFGRIFRKNK